MVKLHYGTSFGVNSKKDLIEFLGLLREDFAKNKENWENWTVDAYLESMQAWLTDTSDKPGTENLTWEFVASILIAPRSYE